VTPLAALVTGLLFALVNAAHCAGMCGAFAMRAAASPGGFSGFLLYGAGKAFTYGFLGALAGWFGTSVLTAGTEAQVILGSSVGAVLIVAAVARMVRPGARSALGVHLAGFLSPLIGLAGRVDSFGGRFALGALTGALPCGVVYFAALQAAATESRVSAFVLMAGFAAGTMPALAAVAWLGRGVLLRVPPRAVRLASGILMLALGVAAVVRALMPLFGDGTSASCCH
jgi:sulfite exporter TauE/SafE